MAGKEHKGDISNVFRIAKTGHISDFKRRITVSIEYLGGVLDTGLTSSINEFLDGAVTKILQESNAEQLTCKNTLPNVLSVSSRKTVENMTVTRSGDARIYIASSSR